MVEEIQRLVKNGLSLRGVAGKTGVSYSIVHRHANQFSKKQTALNLSVFSKHELGYLVGFFVGDGSRIAEKRSGHFGAKFAFDSKRDLDIVSFVRRLLIRSGKRITLYSEGTWLVMKVYSRSSLLYLQDFVRYSECDGETCKVLVNPSLGPRDFTLGFVGGLIDADGHVYKDKRKVGHFGAVITTAIQLAKQLVNLLNGLGLEPKVSEVAPCPTSFSNRPTYFVRLGKAEFCKVCNELICVKHQRCECNAKSF